MTTSAQRGAYYKGKIKAWFEKRGYYVAYLEKVHYIDTPRGRLPIKTDQLGADLLATNGTETIFIQCKGGDNPRQNLAAAVREFRQYAVQGKQLVVCWTTRAKEPELIDAKTYEIRGDVGPLLREDARIDPAAKHRKVDAGKGTFDTDLDKPLF